MSDKGIIIQRCNVCSLDGSKAFEGIKHVIPGDNDELDKFLKSLIKYGNSCIKAKPASFHDGELNLPSNYKEFDDFCNSTAQDIHQILKENSYIIPSSGVFLWVILEEQNVFAFFRLNYQSGIMSVNDKWSLNTNLLSKPSKSGNEFFLINADSQRIKVSDISVIHNSDGTVENLLADKILGVKLLLSEQEILDSIEDVMVSEIAKNYEGDFQDKIFSYRNMMSEKAANEGRIHMADIAENIFDSDENIENCKNELIVRGVPWNAALISNASAKKLQHKHKIQTSSGIEVLIPPELLENENFFSYSNDNGNITIVVKDTSNVSKTDN